jgi:hypothetical protein
VLCLRKFPEHAIALGDLYLSTQILFSTYDK